MKENISINDTKFNQVRTKLMKKNKFQPHPPFKNKNDHIGRRRIKNQSCLNTN